MSKLQLKIAKGGENDSKKGKWNDDNGGDLPADPNKRRVPLVVSLISKGISSVAAKIN